MIIEPSVWGPPFWRTIHYVALGFPPDPTPHIRAGYRKFFETLGMVIPCKICSSHYDQNLRNMPLTDSVMASSTSLFEWTVALHNRVNRDHGKAAFTPEQALILLSHQTQGGGGGDGNGVIDSCGGEKGTLSTRSIVPLVSFAFVVGAALSAVVLIIIRSSTKRGLSRL